MTDLPSILIRIRRDKQQQNYQKEWLEDKEWSRKSSDCKSDGSMWDLDGLKKAELLKKSWHLKPWQKGQAGSEHANRENVQHTFCKNSSAWGLCGYHVPRLSQNHVAHH